MSVASWELIGMNESNRADRLLALISEEERALERTTSRSGWSVWAILIGLGYVVWLLLGVVDTKLPDWQQATTLLVFFTVLTDLARWLFVLLRPVGASIDQTRFVHLNVALASSRFYHIARCACAVALLSLVAVGSTSLYVLLRHCSLCTCHSV